jgi:hypothetical protein
VQEGLGDLRQSDAGSLCPVAALHAAPQGERNAGLKEGEPRLFHSNLLLMRSSGTEADYGTITSGEEHFYAWKTLYPQDDAALKA